MRWSTASSCRCDEPDVPELQRVTQAMNSMVARAAGLFEAQAAQVETLRRAGPLRPADRPGRTARTSCGAWPRCCSARTARPKAAWCCCACRPGRRQPRARPRCHRPRLRTLADARAWPHDGPHGGRVGGRLNGADFALCLAGRGRAGRDAACTCAASLRGARLRSASVAVQSARRGGRARRAGPLLAPADLALARAEAGPFAAEADAPSRRLPAGPASRRWHRASARMRSMRAACGSPSSRARRDRALLHLECPLRLQLMRGGRVEPAARWLPLALRSRLPPALDCTRCAWR